MIVKISIRVTLSFWARFIIQRLDLVDRLVRKLWNCILYTTDPANASSTANLTQADYKSVSGKLDSIQKSD